MESKCTLRLWGCFVRFVCFDCVSNPLRACGRLWVLMPACVILACLGVCCFLDAFSRRFGPVLPRLRGFFGLRNFQAAIAQLGERQTEDLKVPGSIPGLGNFSYLADSGVSKAGCGLLLFRPGLCSSFCRSLDCHLSMARPHPGGAQKLPRARSRTRVTSMGGLYDAATLRALLNTDFVCEVAGPTNPVLLCFGV